MSARLAATPAKVVGQEYNNLSFNEIKLSAGAHNRKFHQRGGLPPRRHRILSPPSGFDLRSLSARSRRIELRKTREIPGELQMIGLGGAVGIRKLFGPLCQGAFR